MAYPSNAQMVFFNRLVDGGKITTENFEAFLANFNEFADEGVYPVTVDYSMSLATMVAAGKRYHSAGYYFSDRYKIYGEGVKEFKLHIIRPHNAFHLQHIEGYIHSLGLELAQIEHLLAFAAKYPDVKREVPIIALGSSCFTLMFGDEWPQLHHGNLGKPGRYNCWKGEWLRSDRNYHFLAFE